MLGWKDRMHLTWELTWPLASLDLIAVFLIRVVADSRDESLTAIWAVIAFFCVGPLVVRRALARRYGGLEIHPRLTWQQSLKVMWLLGWRSETLSLVAIVVFSGLLKLAPGLRATVTTTDPFWNDIGLSLADTVTSLLFYPLLIPAMLRKRYRGFHLEVRSPQIVEAVPLSKSKAKSK